MVAEEGDVPLIQKFSSNSIMDMWENCLAFRVTIKGDSKIYQCEHVGRSLSEAYGNDLKFKYFSSYERDLSLSREFIKALDEAVDKRQFTLSQGQFINYKNKVVKYRDCIMPLKDISGEIRMVVAGVSWRVF
jgi:hypothetical protein